MNITVNVSDEVMNELNREMEQKGKEPAEMAELILTEWALRNHLFRALIRN